MAAKRGAFPMRPVYRQWGFAILAPCVQSPEMLVWRISRAITEHVHAHERRGPNAQHALAGSGRGGDTGSELPERREGHRERSLPPAGTMAHHGGTPRPGPVHLGGSHVPPSAGGKTRAIPAQAVCQ